MPYRRPVSLSALAVLHALLLFAALYPLLAAILSYTGAKFYRFSASGVLILIPILLSLALVHKIRHFSTFFLLGILISGTMVLLGRCWGGFESPVGMSCGIFTGTLSMAVFLIRLGSKIRFGRMKRDFLDFHGRTASFPLHEWDVPDILTRPRPLHWIWFTLLYILGMAGKFTTCLYCLFGIVFVDLFVCLGFCYGDGLCRYVSENQKIAHLPVSAMRRIHRMNGIFAGVLLLLFLLPAVFYGREFRFNPAFENTGIAADEALTQPQDEMPDFSALLPEGEPAPTPEWLVHLMQFFGVLLAVLFALFMIRAIAGWLKKIGLEFSTEDQADETVFLLTEPTDSIGHALRQRRAAHFSEGSKIRRRYRKVIRKATKGQPNRWATPSELEAQAALPDTEEMRTLHEAYERARYARSINTP